MTSAVIIVGLAIVLAIAAILLARSSRGEEPQARDISGMYVEGFPAKHPRMFPVIRQALSSTDAEFLEAHVARGPRKRVLAARRAAAMYFLEGLRTDFGKLTELSRVLAKAAPESEHASEMERLKLEWRFHILYLIVWFKLKTGALPIAQLHTLSDTIGAMALRLEIAMNAWQDASLLPKAGLS